MPVISVIASFLTTYLTIRAIIIALRVVLFLTLLVALYKLFYMMLDKLVYILPSEFTDMLGCFLPDNMADFIMAICLAKIATAVFNAKSHVISMF